MTLNIRKIVIQLRTVIITVAIVAAISGWIGVFLEDEVAIASLSTRFYYTLYLVIPIILFVTGRMARSQKRPRDTINTGNRILSGLVVGIIGSIVGTLIFVVLVLVLPSVFGGKDWGMIQDELFTQIGWLKILYLVVITALAAVGTGFLSQKKSRRLE